MAKVLFESVALVLGAGGASTVCVGAVRWGRIGFLGLGG